MNAFEVGKKLVELCNHGKNVEAMQTLYSPDIVSIEAADNPAGARETRGFDGVLAKGKWWSDNHIVHSQAVEGPYPNGDRFIVRFKYDITNKPSNHRMAMDEMGLFTVENGKVVREEFFYPTGS
jgi:ketosteroid isomerase-like protein